MSAASEILSEFKSKLFRQERFFSTSDVEKSRNRRAFVHSFIIGYWRLDQFTSPWPTKEEHHGTT
jgi:hypothetical protein